MPSHETKHTRTVPRLYFLVHCALIVCNWTCFSFTENFWPGGNAYAASNSLVPVVRQAERVGASPPLHSIQPLKPQQNINGEMPIKEIPLGRRFIGKATVTSPESRQAPDAVDPVVQDFAPEPKTPAPFATFDGISNADNQAVHGGQVLPPDPVGDVGPNHYVQAVNLLFEVFDKSGNSLLGPLAISDIFAGLGGPCANTDDGDPIVLYDHLADRWLISQFAVVGPPSRQCIAISQTGDPTGAYHLYDFAMPNNKFNDYPKFGVWPDAYYMTDNQFDPSFAGAGAFAFDRANMLAGNAATFIYFDLEPLDPNIGGMLPADLDGPPPPAGTPNYFVYYTADEFGDPQDGLRIFEFHANFATPGNSTFTERSDSPVATAPFNPLVCGNLSVFNCIPQKSTGVRLDAIWDRLMFRLQYRNFGTHESLVTNHTVNAGINRAGVRYYELRRDLPGGGFNVNEQATFAPDADHRWMGSAAMDAAGNIAVGYSVSGTDTFPSIRYAARLATDPPGGLFQGEAVLQAGKGAQTSFLSRWGDYSMLAVDPVNGCTFWYVQEYYASTSQAGWRTKIGSFQLPECFHDIAVTKIIARKRVKVVVPTTVPVKVQIQNRSIHTETIDAADLGDGTNSGLVRLNVTVVDDDGEGCGAGVALDDVKNARMFTNGPKLLKSKRKLNINYLVTYNCVAAQKVNRDDPTPGDFEYTATVHHDVLDGIADDHADDDACPHDALPNQVDDNPPPKGVKDKGCGNRKFDGTLGDPVQTDALGDL